jgi:hypothetical protein
VVPISSESGEFETLGIPPLAGIATYEEAARPGLDVDESVERLRRIEFFFRHLHLVSARFLPTVPEWEAKCGLGLHSWLDAEACAGVRDRIGELRHPAPRFEDSPDIRLSTLFHELVESESTVELLAGLELVRSEVLSAIDEYLSLANPLADFPTVFLLRRIRGEQVDVLGWTRAALTGLTHAYGEDAAPWTAHIQSLLERPDLSNLALRQGAEKRDVNPRRDRRF